MLRIGGAFAVKGVTRKRQRGGLERAAPVPIAILLVFSLAAAGCASTSVKIQKQDAEAADRLLHEAIAAARSRDNVLANTLAKRVIASPGFRGMEDAERHKTYTMVSATAALLHRSEECYRFARIATELPDFWNDEWRLRVTCAYSTERWADASYALTIIASTWPSDLGDHSDLIYLTTWNHLRSLPGGDARRLSLGAWMVHEGWRPKGRPEAFLDVWRDLARLEDVAARPDLRDVAFARIKQTGRP